MKYHCAECNYIYDENFWEKEFEILPYTSFWELDDSFYCPMCLNPKDNFVPLQEEIMTPFDINNLTIIEEVHFPKYEIFEDILNVEIIHEQEEDHFIYKIAIFDENSELIEEKSTKNVKEISFDIEYLDSFEIRVYCNLEWIFSTWLINR